MSKTAAENFEKETIMTDTKKETDKKCPDCGGVMDFDPQTGGLTCPFCGHKEAIAADKVQKNAAELDFESAEKTGNCDWGVQTKTVICKSCGGEMVYDAMCISGECPYCGSNQVMEAKDKDTLAPGGVCVFKIDKKQAAVNFKSWIKHKWFCPKAAKEKAKPDKIHGVYLPYWTFDADTFSAYTARYGINRTVTGSDGKPKTVTDWHKTKGTYSEFINDQLVLGTTNHNADILSRIEPFNTEDNLAYKPEYIAGFASERYTTGLKDAWKKAKEFIKKRLTSNIEKKVRDDNNADKVDSVAFEPIYNNIKYKYLLLPVYMSSFKYQDKVYQFMVNGQTGEVGGKSPVSPLRVCFAILLGILAIIAIIAIKNHAS